MKNYSLELNKSKKKERQNIVYICKKGESKMIVIFNTYCKLLLFLIVPSNYLLLINYYYYFLFAFMIRVMLTYVHVLVRHVLRILHKENI